ncbi:MAG: Gfo/Idh/MocA family protein [Thermomicrobiales bacterium]
MPAARRDYRVGVVGLSGRGRQLASYWTGMADARLVAVADSVPEQLDQTHTEISDVACYADYQQMLAEADLDILTIALTEEQHAAVTRDACARGIRAIYCEKPMASSLADADVMINACRDSGAVLQISHPRRWMDPIVRVRTAIQEGAIGQPTFGFLYWPTGRVAQEGTHLFDAVNFMLDSRPVEVVGRVQRGLDLTRVDDHPVYRTRSHDDPGAIGFITYANGARVCVDALNDVLMPPTYILGGSRGRFDIEEAPWRIDYRARDADTHNHNQGRTAPARRDFPAPVAEAPGDAERRGFQEMIACITSGATPTSSGADGRSALETIVAFHLSSDAGVCPVSLPLPASANDFQLIAH